MAMAEEFLRHRYGTEVQDHFTYAIVSDGDLMEGVASEAASHAGQLGLGRLIYLYDDNDISLDGPTSLSFSVEDRGKRFEAYGWQVLSVDDANDVAAIEAAIEEGKAETERPTLIRVKSIIGYPSPNKQGSRRPTARPSARTRSAPPRRSWAGTPTRTSSCPTASTTTSARAPSAAARSTRRGTSASRPSARPTPTARRVGRAWSDPSRPLPGLADALRTIEWSKDKLATRAPARRSWPPCRLRADDGRRRGRPVRVDQDGVPRRPRGRASSTASRTATSSGACASTAWAAR
jgi:transketolase